MSMMNNLAVTCQKYKEILLFVADQKNDLIAFTDTLQLQVDLVRSRMETLTAIITKGRTIEL